MHADSDVDLASINTYLPAVKACVDAHPILSTVIQEADSEEPMFVRPTKLDLTRHIRIQTLDETLTDEEDALKSKLSALNDEQFDHCERIPPWRVDITPLSARATQPKCLIAFAFSHSVGDGLSGSAFHRTFLDSLRTKTDWDGDSTIPTPEIPLPPSLDDRLSVSWGYLLGPALGTYLPTIVSKYLGSQIHVSPITDSTWIGTPTFYKPESHNTGLELIRIDNETVEMALNECRKHQAKLSGLLHQFIVHALVVSFPPAVENKELVSTTPIDLRQNLGVTRNSMGVYTSAVYALHNAEGLSTAPASGSRRLDYDRMWSEARSLTSSFAESAATIKNQPIGLIKYVRNMRAWTLESIGKRRGYSYELSNVMSFDPAPGKGIKESQRDGKWKLKKLIFTQPANCSGAALSFNVISLKGGPMVIALTWQLGAFGFADENGFAQAVCKIITSDFEELAETCREA